MGMTEMPEEVIIEDGDTVVETDSDGVNIETPGGDVKIDGDTVEVDTDEVEVEVKDNTGSTIIGTAFAETSEEEVVEETAEMGTEEEVIVEEVEFELTDEIIAKFKKTAENDVKKLTEVKEAIEGIAVPEGYEEIQKNVLTCYEKLIEGIEMGIEKVEAKDSEGIIASSDVVDEATRYMDTAMQGLEGKGYEPSEDFNKAVEEVFTAMQN